jgi:SdiA-regulated
MQKKVFVNQSISRFFLCMLLLTGCTGAGNKTVLLKGYNLSEPERFLMSDHLLEISGICFYKGNGDTVYAIQDEEGKLFRLAWNIKKPYASKFGKKGDYEDLAIINEKIFILKSNGTLYSFPFAGIANEEISSVLEYKELVPEGEYEGMYGDNTTGKLYIICKNCSVDNDKSGVSGYVIDADDSLRLSGNFKLNVKDVVELDGKAKKSFRPSAIAKNPLTGEWYIISAVNKLLMVTDSAWKIKETARLSERIFRQPEGIAFDNEGNLYISNEGDDFSQGNILKFRRQVNQ